MALDGISFLPADVSSIGFGRERAARRRARWRSTPSEIAEFDEIVERTIAVTRDDFESGFVAESPDKLRRLPRYYAALAGAGAVSRGRRATRRGSRSVVEADGAVRPCFFHEPIGNMRRGAARRDRDAQPARVPRSRSTSAPIRSACAASAR